MAELGVVLFLISLHETRAEFIHNASMDAGLLAPLFSNSRSYLHNGYYLIATEFK